MHKCIVLFAIVGLALVGSVLAQQTSKAPAASSTTAPPAPPAPTPTPTPAPNITCNYVTTKPNPSAASYTYETCIVARFGAYFATGPNQYVELNNGHVDTQNSKCEKAVNGTNPLIVVHFDCGEVGFLLDRTNNTIFVKSINGYYKIGTEEPIHFKNSTPLFETQGQDHYYKCNSEQSVLDDGKKVSLMVSNFAIEAYRTASGTEFYKVPQECALDSSQVSDLVRIGVGICLVALVVLVLIAYFVGRRRWSERSSYESV